MSINIVPTIIHAVICSQLHISKKYYRILQRNFLGEFILFIDLASYKKIIQRIIICNSDDLNFRLLNYINPQQPFLGTLFIKGYRFITYSNFIKYVFIFFIQLISPVTFFLI